MVDACAANGLKAFYGPFGDFSDAAACEASSATPSCSAAPAPGRFIRPRSAIAKAVFSPDAAEVAFARRILDAMPDGSGAVMIDGKMQDDATWKQAKVIVDLARTVAAGDQRARERLRIMTSRRCFTAFIDRSQLGRIESLK